MVGQHLIRFFLIPKIIFNAAALLQGNDPERGGGCGSRQKWITI